MHNTNNCDILNVEHINEYNYFFQQKIKPNRESIHRIFLEIAQTRALLY